MSPVFWQYLLAGELPAKKSRALVESLGTSPSLEPVAALLQSELLSSAEKQRFKRADMRALENAIAKGVHVLEDPPYRADSSHFPPALFAWGDTTVLDRPTVAIVGTRGASTYGKAVARKYAEAFAEAGVTVVSGGALGIDTQAHQGALDANGCTAVVLGCGVDISYPASNTTLFQRVRERGCMLSPFSVGAPTLEYRFLARNQVVAALAQAVVVIEAPARSGSTTTALACAEQGKPVFVVPGSITQASFRGSHALIRDGAMLTDHPEQVLSFLDVAPAANLFADADLAPEQQLILDCLEDVPLSPEKISELTGIEPSTLMAELTLLELAGQVISDGVGYSRKP